MKDFLKSIKSDTVYIFGVNLNATILASSFKKETNKEVIFLDNRAIRRKQQRFMNIPCMLPRDIEPNQTCIITARSQESQTSMEQQIKGHNCNDVIVWQAVKGNLGGGV